MKYVASVTNSGLGLETAMSSTVNRGWYFSLTVNTGNLSQIISYYTETSFQLNDGVFPKGFNTILIRI